MEIERINPCKIKKQRQEEMVFPAKIFGYLAMCQKVKYRAVTTQLNAIPVYSNLPLVSSITEKYSPAALLHTHWAFLRY